MTILSLRRSILSFLFCSAASSEVILVFANASSRVRKSILTSSGVVAIPLGFFAGGLEAVFGLTLGPGGAGATAVVNTGAALEKVIEGTDIKVVMEVVQGITICLVLMRLLVVMLVVATWQLVTGRLPRGTTGATGLDEGVRQCVETAVTALSMVSSRLKNETSSARLLREQATLEI